MGSHILQQFFDEIGDTIELVGEKPVGVHTRGLFGVTPLHLAAYRGNTEIVRLVLDSGAEVDPPGEEACTPLHEAISGGHVETARLLICRGAELRLRSGVRYA